jgi:glycosyltransferase involved in cell wall biosynthesis
VILYVTYNDQPTGVYWSQVTSVVDHLNSLQQERVKLVALVSVRGYFGSFRSIRRHSPGAWVLPMVPRAHNWRANWVWLALVARFHRPVSIIARGVFATAMALKLRDRGLVKRVCFDGRGGYGVEWEEYRIVDDDRLIAECSTVEEDAVKRADVRLAVSHVLVDHWRQRYGYRGNEHVVIPCTLGEEQEVAEPVDPLTFRQELGWSMDDLVLVYSGSTVGWQSLDLLAKVLDRILRHQPGTKVLFLSATDGYIDHLAHIHPGQVARLWLPHARVQGALKACDVGLLVRSDSETNRVASPTKFAEYLSAGLPVLISSNIGDLSGTVSSNGLGWIHDPDKPPALRRFSQEERAGLVAFSRTHFSKQAYDAEYGHILSRLAGAPASAPTGDLVSIVVPSFNKGRYISEMIASVQAQTHPEWELLFVDDASEDGTQATIAALAAGDPRIRTIFLPQNKGANHCRNIGLHHSKGAYVIFLDADDLLGSDCLRSRLQVARQESLDLCVFTMEVFRGRKGDSTHRWEPSSREPLADFFRHKLPWSVMQPIWRRSFLERIGGFDERFKRHQDVEFHTRALLEPGVRFRTVVGEPDCFYRISEERKVLRPYELLEGFVESSMQYHHKFLEAATARGMRSLLLGIIYQTYLQVLLNFKNGVITREQFTVLEGQLFTPHMREQMGASKRLLFRLARLYTLMPLRVPGVNLALYRAITG